MQLWTHWLSHIELLIKIVMKKSRVHIELIYFQIILCYQCQQNSNRRMLHNRWEYLIVINTLFLSPWPCSEQSIFLCKYPLATNGLLSFGKLWQFSSVILMKRLHPFQHGILSHLWLWVDPDLSIWGWNTLLYDQESIYHNHIWSEPCGLTWFFFSVLLVAIESWIWPICDPSFSTSSISSLATWSPSCATSGENSNNIKLSRVCGVTSISTRYDTSVVCPLATCWEL